MSLNFLVKKPKQKILKRVTAFVTALALTSSMAFSVSADTIWISHKYNDPTYPLINSDNNESAKTSFGFNSTCWVSPFTIHEGVHNGQSALCIEPGVTFNSIPNDNGLDKDYVWLPGGAEDWEDEEGDEIELDYRSAWDNLSRNQRYTLGLITYYGYPMGGETENMRIATQLLMWEVVKDQRKPCIKNVDTSAFATSTNLSYNKLQYDSKVTHTTKAKVKTAYNRIVKRVSEHYSKPDILIDGTNTVKLKYNPNTKQYVGTFSILKGYEQQDGDLSWYDIRSALTKAGISYTVANNDSGTRKVFTVTSKTPLDKTVTVEQSIEDVPAKYKPFLSSEAVKHGDSDGTKKRSQMLLAGSAKADKRSGKIIFDSPSTVKGELDKTYVDTRGWNVTGDELKELLANTEFYAYCQYTDTNGTAHTKYVQATQSGNTYNFSDFVDGTSKTIMKAGYVSGQTYGLFTIAGLPDPNNMTNVQKGTFKYYVKENKVGAGAGIIYTKKNAELSVSSGTTPKTGMTNTGSELGKIFFTKYFFDSNNELAVPDSNLTANTAKFAIATWYNNKIMYLSDEITDHGSYYSLDKVSDDGKSFLASSLTDSINGAYEFSLYYIPQNKGTYFFRLEGLPLNNNTLPPLMIIETASAVGYGYDTGYLSTERPAGTIRLSSINTQAKFNSQNGYVTYARTAQPACDEDGKCGNDYIIHLAKSYIADSGESEISMDMENYAWTPVVSIKKVDDDGEPLEGALIGLYADRNDTEEPLLTGYTDKNGELYFNAHLEFGKTYWVREIKAPKGYTEDRTSLNGAEIDGWRLITTPSFANLAAVGSSTLSREIFSREVVFNGRTKASFTDSPYYGQVDFTKYSDDGKQLADAVYQLVTLQDLTEKQMKNFSIDSSKSKSFKSGDVIAEFSTTDTSASHIWGIPLGGYDENTDTFQYSYYLVEKSVKAPYVVSSEQISIEFTLDNPDGEYATGTMPLKKVAVEAKDNPQIVELKISKKGDDKKAIEGVKFNIYANEDITVGNRTFSKGTLICTTPPTDANGLTMAMVEEYNDEAQSNILVNAPIFSGYEYLVKEVADSVPAPYIASAEPQTFTVDYNNTPDLTFVEKTLNFVNDWQEGYIKIYKIASGEGSLAAGTEVPLEGAVYEVIALEDVTVEGTSYNKNDVIETITTGADGKATSKKIYPVEKKFGLREKKAPVGYYISKDVTEAVIPFDSTLVYDEVNKVYPPTDKEWVLEDKKNEVEFEKKDEDGNRLAGAVIQIKRGDKVIDEWTTKANEDHVITGTLEGGIEYTVHEKSAPDGYVATADFGFRVEVYAPTGEDGKQIVTIIDKSTKVRFSKKSTTGVDELPGAKLQVLDKDGNVIDEWISTTEPHEIVAELIAGAEYTFHEVVSPDGYAYSDDVPFKVAEDGEWQFVSMEDKPTTVKISKKSITGDDELPGASLQILDKDGNIIESWISTTEPHYITAKLIAGQKYTLHEEIAPDGYVIANDVIFTVNLKGEVDVVEMYDDYTKIEIAKYDADTGEILAGAKLQILDGEKVVEEWTSTTEPHRIDAKLVAGKSYILHEVEAPEYYELAADVEFTVSTDGRIDSITISDYQKKGNIEIHKTTEGMLNLGGIKFVLSGTSDLGHEVNIEAVTDDYGVALFEHIPLGTYTVTEDGETTPTAYLVADPIEVEVFYAETTTKEIFNEEKTGSIKVQKRTEGEMNLENIKFVLSGTSDSGREIEIESVTDSDGIATFENVPIGTYMITEDGESTPYAYMVAEPTEVEVFYAETTTKEIYNIEKTGSIEIHKTTEGMINLSGIKFILSGTSDSGREIEIEAITDSDGIATFENVPIGTYTITEYGATVPTAYLVADPFEVEVYYAETTTKEVHNDEKCGTIEIQKKTEGMINLEGIQFILSGTSDGGRKVEEYAVTDENGQATFYNIPTGTYTITEDGETVPYGYLVADDTSVEVYYAETTTVEIVNDTTKVSFSKHGMSGDDELPGAVLQVLDLEGNLIEEWTTTNKAHVIEGVLGVGQTYILHEKSAPAGYKVADDIEFVVEDSAEIQYVVMRDESAPDSSSSSSRPDSSSTPNSTPNTPPSTPPDNNPPTGGIGGGIAIAMLILGAATVVVRKKNDD